MKKEIGIHGDLTNKQWESMAKIKILTTIDNSSNFG
jgi:hypothetical protein